MVSADITSDLSPVAPPPSKQRGRRRSIGVLAVLVLAILALLSQGLLHSLNYFETVGEVFAHRSSIGTEVIRLEGVVQPGSISRSSNGATFTLTGAKGQKVYVDAHGSPPQLFQANIPVVVVGHFTSPTSLTFDGTQIMVKHSASYIAAYPSRVKAPNGTSR